MKSLPSSPNARPLLSFALFVSVMRSSLMSELRHQCAVAEAKNSEKRAHDRSGARDDDPGHDAHFSVGVAFRHPVRAAPNLDDAPDEPGEEQHAETVLERGLERR